MNRQANDKHTSEIAQLFENNRSWAAQMAVQVCEFQVAEDQAMGFENDHFPSPASIAISINLARSAACTFRSTLAM